MEADLGIIILFGVIALIVIITAVASIRIIRPYEKGIVERLGRYQRTADSGLTLIMPYMETLTKMDMREQVVDVPPQAVITSDNVVVQVDAVVYFEITIRSRFSTMFPTFSLRPRNWPRLT